MKNPIPTHRTSSSRRAFTLIEIVLVMVIITVLLGAVIFQVTPYLDEAKRVKIQMQVGQIETGLLMEQTKRGRYLTEEEGLETLVQGGWIERKGLTDPFERKYQYKNPGERSEKDFDVYSRWKDVADPSDDYGNFSLEEKG